MPVAVTLLDLHAAVLTHLRIRFSTDTRDVYDGKVTDPRVDDEGRIQPYIVVWLAPGTDPESPLDGPAGNEHRVHVTAAGMDPMRAAWAVDRATSILDGAVLPVGLQWADVRWLDGYTPPPISEDRDTSPPRWFCPLIFTATAG